LFSFPAFLHSPRRVLPLGLLGGLVLAVLPAASAQAAGLAGSCDNATLTQPFAPWGDTNSYKLVPGGDFEGSLAGWTLTGGAKTVPDSEPSGATGSVGKWSMYLPAGASVQSPFTCVDFMYPTFRLFARNDSLLSTVAVSIVYKEPVLGLSLTLPVGVITLGGTWRPTAAFQTLASEQSLVNALLAGGATPQVALRFTALVGPSQIDDVFIDPWKYV
jgi:hypothetical protein